MRPAALLLLVLAAGCVGDATDAPAPPVVVGDVMWADDGADNPGFAVFRDSLRAIVARRDTAALLAVVAPGARLSFGDDAGGPDGFRTMWFEGDGPRETMAWDALGLLLDGGSVDEDGAVMVPAAAALWPDSLHAADHVAVPGTAVAARRSATDTTVVARLSRVYLPITESPSEGWWSVRLPDGTPAVVATRDAVSPFGYRAMFWDDGDGWRLQSFVAGD